MYNLITIETFEEAGRPYGSLPAYQQARCLNCAKAAKEKDERDPKVRPKRVLGTYQAISTMTGFEGVLKKHCLRDNQGTVRPHPRLPKLNIKPTAAICYQNLSNALAIGWQSRQGECTTCQSK